jgi:hypothetical protein
VAFFDLLIDLLLQKKPMNLTRFERAVFHRDLVRIPKQMAAAAQL